MGRVTTNPDIAMIDALVNDAVGSGVVDPTRIYIGGWGNGGFFAQLYAVARARAESSVQVRVPSCLPIMQCNGLCGHHPSASNERHKHLCLLDRCSAAAIGHVRRCDEHLLRRRSFQQPDT
eukprot:SAG11_NODE_4501_length_1873_cov_1.788032_1_plen_121_part_00